MSPREAWLGSGLSLCLVGSMSLIHSTNIRWTPTVCQAVELLNFPSGGEDRQWQEKEVRYMECQVVITFKEKHNGGLYEKGWLGNLHRVILESLTEQGPLDSRLPVSQMHRELVVLRALAQPEMLFLQISRPSPTSFGLFPLPGLFLTTFSFL